MTRKRNDEHSTEFGLWLRDQKELDSRKEKYTATNLDFIWSNYVTKKYMLLEEKRKMSKCTWSQYNLYKTLSDKIDDENYCGFFVIQFENTSPDDGATYINGKRITTKGVIRFLQFDDEVIDYLITDIDIKLIMKSNF